MSKKPRETKKPNLAYVTLLLARVGTVTVLPWQAFYNRFYFENQERIPVDNHEGRLELTIVPNDGPECCTAA